MLIIRNPFSVLCEEWNRRHANQVRHTDQSTFIRNIGSDQRNACIAAQSSGQIFTSIGTKLLHGIPIVML